ncbi:hypothetical protein Tco_0440565, partial [Tanacetum coccineum]
GDGCTTDGGGGRRGDGCDDDKVEMVFGWLVVCGGSGDGVVVEWLSWNGTAWRRRRG